MTKDAALFHRLSQVPFLPLDVSESVGRLPFLRFFPCELPVLDTVAILPSSSSFSKQSGGGGACGAKRLSRLIRRLERDDFQVLDMHMTKLSPSQVGLLTEAWREAATYSKSSGTDM